ncbi:MAG: PAS domain-containing protein, partial [Elusimicrobiota bacterium]
MPILALILAAHTLSGCEGGQQAVSAQSGGAPAAPSSAAAASRSAAGKNLLAYAPPSDFSGASPEEAAGQSGAMFDGSRMRDAVSANGFVPVSSPAGHTGKRLPYTAAASERITDLGGKEPPLPDDYDYSRSGATPGSAREAGQTLLGFAKITRDLTIRRAAEQALRRSEQSLASTLYSIGDGVIATDEAGRVTRVNRVAEELTGWPEAAAIGQPFETVFNIVSETTREVAASPARRVLTEGVIVGLANHTALI